MPDTKEGPTWVWVIPIGSLLHLPPTDPKGPRRHPDSKENSWISPQPSWECPESPEENHMDPKGSRWDTRQIERPGLSPNDDVKAQTRSQERQGQGMWAGQLRGGGVTQGWGLWFVLVLRRGPLKWPCVYSTRAFSTAQHGGGKGPGNPVCCREAARFQSRKRKKKSEVTSWSKQVNLRPRMERPNSLLAVEGGRKTLRSHPVGLRPLSPGPARCGWARVSTCRTWAALGLFGQSWRVATGRTSLPTTVFPLAGSGPGTLGHLSPVRHHSFS